jgi:eukaryotic-like serine/threonine-protein kinase
VSEGRGAEDRDDGDRDDPAPTVVDRPGGRAEPTPTAILADAAEPPHRPSGSLGGMSKSSLGGITIGSPHDALRHAEILRTRKFCLIGGSIAIAGALAVPQLPGGYVTTRLFLVGISVAIVGLVYLLYRTRNPETYYEGWGVPVGWYIPVLGVTTSVPFFGAFSPVPILLVLGIFFNGLGARGGVALATYLSCAAVQAVSGGLVVAGVIDDPGIIHASYLPAQFQLICQVLVQLILLGTFMIARASRASSLTALAQLEKAVRAVAQREALLDEARAELRRALGSGRGRFTDQQIGNFLLGDVIGRGAMGEVYQGVDTRDDQPVAVKMLAIASLGNPQHVERFLRELQTAATISSPHVVRVIAVGEQPLPHLVMERLRGRDLATILRTKRTLDRDRVIELLRQVGEGITAAAQLGIVHRDLKPQNLFLHGSTWKILDFGVSRVAESSDTLTSGQVVGTPAYMAPEQARGAKVDHRTDLYSLGAVCYRALTGHSLFASGELAQTLYNVVHGAPRRPSSLVTLPRDIDLVLAIALAKDPAQRFATAAELAAAVEAGFANKLPESLRERGRKLEADGAWDGERRRS